MQSDFKYAGEWSTCPLRHSLRNIFLEIIYISNTMGNPNYASEKLRNRKLRWFRQCCYFIQKFKIEVDKYWACGPVDTLRLLEYTKRDFGPQIPSRLKLPTRFLEELCGLDPDEVSLVHGSVSTQEKMYWKFAEAFEAYNIITVPENVTYPEPGNREPMEDQYLIQKLFFNILNQIGLSPTANRERGLKTYIDRIPYRFFKSHPNCTAPDRDRIYHKAVALMMDEVQEMFVEADTRVKAVNILMDSFREQRKTDMTQPPTQKPTVPDRDRESLRKQEQERASARAVKAHSLSKEIQILAAQVAEYKAKYPDDDETRALNIDERYTLENWDEMEQDYAVGLISDEEYDDLKEAFERASLVADYHRMETLKHELRELQIETPAERGMASQTLLKTIRMLHARITGLEKRLLK